MIGRNSGRQCLSKVEKEHKRTPRKNNTPQKGRLAQNKKKRPKKKQN